MKAGNYSAIEGMHVTVKTSNNCVNENMQFSQLCYQFELPIYELPISACNGLAPADNLSFCVVLTPSFDTDRGSEPRARCDPVKTRSVRRRTASIHRLERRFCRGALQVPAHGAVRFTAGERE